MAEAAETTAYIAPPIPRTSLIGREAERAVARAFLIDDAVPLLTLTGPGGSGKTRLALAIAADVAAHFADGAVWVDLAPLADPSLVPSTVANALGVIPAPGRPVAEALARYLRPLQTLLLLDNCEHVLPAVAELVSVLLSSCPALQVLATSRAPLHIRGEQELLVEPLPLPAGDVAATVASVQENDAIRLFVERARSMRPAFRLDETNAALIADVCKRLDGLPLAIELAAARTKILSPEALLAQMSDRLRLLTGGPRDMPARQQTIRDTIVWSYGLLSPEDQAAFRRLAVFAGGWTVESANSVAGENQIDVVAGLHRLADQSLIRADDIQHEPRFAMLETIREYGLERLAESGEEPEIRDRHAAHFVDLVERLDATTAPYLPAGKDVLARLEVEHPNIRSALAHLAEVGAIEQLLRLAGNLGYFWELRGHLREGLEWLEQSLAVGQDASAEARSVALRGQTNLLWARGEFQRALCVGEEGLALARAAGDPHGVALTAELCGLSAFSLGRFAQATALLAETLAAAERTPDAPWAARAMSNVSTGLGWVAFNEGDLDAAVAHFTAAVKQDRKLVGPSGGFAWASWPLIGLGGVFRSRGETRNSLIRFQDALALAWRYGEVRAIEAGLSGVAGLLAASARWELAARVLGAAEALRERAGIPPDPRRPEPSFADAEGAARLWAAGRLVPLAEIVAEALAADLASLPAAAPLPALSITAAPDSLRLTRREQEILALLCGRLTDPEIAEQLFLSPRTVESHVHNILGKLGAENRRDAAAIAARLISV